MRVWYSQTDCHAIHIRFCSTHYFDFEVYMKMVDFERIVSIVLYEICHFGFDIKILHFEWQRVKCLSFAYSHTFHCLATKYVFETAWKNAKECGASDEHSSSSNKIPLFLCLWSIKRSVNTNLSIQFSKNAFLVVSNFDYLRWYSVGLLFAYYRCFIYRFENRI